MQVSLVTINSYCRQNKLHQKKLRQTEQCQNELRQDERQKNKRPLEPKKKKKTGAMMNGAKTTTRQNVES